MIGKKENKSGSQALLSSSEKPSPTYASQVSSTLPTGGQCGTLRLEGERGQFHSSRSKLFLLPSLLTAHALHFYGSSMVFQVFFAGLFIAGIIQNSKASVTHYIQSANTMGNRLKSLSTHSCKLHQGA